MLPRLLEPDEVVQGRPSLAIAIDGCQSAQPGPPHSQARWNVRRRRYAARHGDFHHWHTSLSRLRQDTDWLPPVRGAPVRRHAGRLVCIPVPERPCLGQAGYAGCQMIISGSRSSGL
jgi:hypothetical protein